MWYLKTECKEAEVFSVENSPQNTSSSSVIPSNAFNKNIDKHSIASAKWGQ